MVVLSLAGAGTAIAVTGLLALAGWPLWVLVALGCVMSTFQTLGAPAFISIVNDLVPPRAISSGVALTFLGFNVGRIVGGVVGGVMLAALSTDIVVAAALTIVVAGVMQAVPVAAHQPPAGQRDRGADDGPLDAAPIDRGRVLHAPLPDARADHPRLDRARRHRVVVHVPAAGRHPRPRREPGSDRPAVRRRRHRRPPRRAGGRTADASRRARPDDLRGDGAHRRGPDQCRAVGGPRPGGDRHRRRPGWLRDLRLVEPVARPVAVTGPLAWSRHLAVHAAVLGPDAVRRPRRRAHRRALERALRGRSWRAPWSSPAATLLFVLRPQIATLRIDRAAGTVSGRLEGSGYAGPSEA